jgi:ABC-type transporter Mla maintaining outer membrane lipid asymmetry ATPase subunit MlaF
MEAKILETVAVKMNLTPAQAIYLPSVIEKLQRDFGLTKWTATHQLSTNADLRDYVASVIKTLA